MRKQPHNFHKEFRLINFTTFSDAKLEFVSGVNAIIGENGTGKTHILKALYAWQSVAVVSGVFGADEKLKSVFQVEDSHELVRTTEESNATGRIEGLFGEGSWFRNILRTGGGLASMGVGGGSTISSHIDTEVFTSLGEPVFFPAQDMMGHTKSFLSTYERYKIDFDETLRDLVFKLLLPEERKLEKAYSDLIKNLEKALDGKIELEGERFYLVTKDGRFSMTTVAEGLRKIATLVRLIQVSVLGPGTTLYWDEPESNLNPALMDDIVKAILTLSRHGVQVILGTHSYLILKELEIQSQPGDQIKFFSLERTKNGTKVNPAFSYLELSPNPIEDQYSSLYDRDIDKQIKEIELNNSHAKN